MVNKPFLIVVDSSPLLELIAPVIKQFVRLTNKTDFTTTNVMCWCAAQALERNYYTCVKNHYKNSYPENIIYSAIHLEIENYFFHALPFDVFRLFGDAVLTIRPRGQNLYILME